MRGTASGIRKDLIRKIATPLSIGTALGTTDSLMISSID